MPFKSKKQMRLLAWKHPEVYKKWKKKYGIPKKFKKTDHGSKE
jgi:hypothetical protein